MTYLLTWLPQVLANAGLKVAQQSGWETRGHGDVGAIRGVICHHTAGPLGHGNMPSLGVVTDGRADLSGPLAQLCLGRDGTYYIVAAGRAYHAGAGSWQGIVTGNTSFIGIEAENTGLTNEPWPAVQLDAYRRGVAAILTRIGATAMMCCGHKEYALPKGRKTDPSFDMDDFRRQVAAVMAGSVAQPAPIPKDDGPTRPTLRRDVTGNDAAVREVQQKLNRADPGLHLTESGIFDADTEAAVREFQRTRGLVPDGIVGPRTWTALP